jgi:hypothetical protein
VPIVGLSTGRGLDELDDVELDVVDDLAGADDRGAADRDGAACEPDDPCEVVDP